ncbi:MAG: hypothetical protein ISR75_06920 [Phycisphaerales bacterium]|nr:hypothetical protein [Phycisphaerales bacterium]
MVRILIAIVAVIVGLIVGSAVNWGIGSLNVVFFPMPEGVPWQDTDAIIAWIKTLPQQAFILVLLAHLSQSFVGGFVAALIAKQNMMCVALVVGAISMLAGIANMLMIHAPAWLWIEMPLYLVTAYFGAKIVMNMRSTNTDVCC